MINNSNNGTNKNIIYDMDIFKVIMDACDNNKIDVIKDLLHNETIYISYLTYIIIHASYSGNLEIIKLLLNEKRVDPSADNNDAIRIACMNGYLDIVKLLLDDERVDPSANNNFAIIYACKNGHFDIVKLL